MKIVIVRADLSETNKLLARIAGALEAQIPTPADTEVSDVVIDEVESLSPKDESAGLDDIRKQLQKELRKSF